MPLQNRVTPFGDIVAVTARGTLMGNRGGRLHGPDRTLGPRRWTGRAWIACVLCFKDRRRTVMGDGYTELFFLDEPTALAAGHRPCFECRRAEAKAFAAAWAAAHGLPEPPRAGEMDIVLHRQRLAPSKPVMPLAGLPDGAMVALPADPARAWLVMGDRLHAWSPGGYGPAIPQPDVSATLLTPPAIVETLRAGYAPRPASIVPAPHPSTSSGCGVDGWTKAAPMPSP